MSAYNINIMYVLNIRRLSQVQHLTSILAYCGKRDVYPLVAVLVDELVEGQVQLLCQVEDLLVVGWQFRCCYDVSRFAFEVLRVAYASYCLVEQRTAVTARYDYRFTVGFT